MSVNSDLQDNNNPQNNHQNNNQNNYHHNLPHHRSHQSSKTIGRSHRKHENENNQLQQEYENQLVQQQHNRTKQLKLQQQKLNQSKPCVYSISVDYGNENKDDGDDGDNEETGSSKNINSSGTSSWIGAVGMLFGYTNISSNQQPNQLIVQSGQYEGSRFGSYGYLMHQIGNTMCPPDKITWESLLISRVEELVLDLVCEQIISLSCGLLEATKVITILFIYLKILFLLIYF